MKTQHTPGPWKHEATRRRITAKSGTIIYKVSLGDDLREEEANARLISAAPELLEALGALVNGEITLSNKSSALYSKSDFKGFLSEHCPKTIAARAAIAKAKGE